MAGDRAPNDEPEELTPNDLQDQHGGPSAIGRAAGGPVPGAGGGAVRPPVHAPAGDSFSAWLRSWPADSVALLCRIDPKSKRMQGQNGIERRRVDAMLASDLATEYGCSSFLLSKCGGGAFRWSIVLPDGASPTSGGTYTIQTAEPERSQPITQPAPVAPGSDAVELRRLEIEAAERAHLRTLELRRLEIDAETVRAEREERLRRQESEERRAEERRAEIAKLEAEERRAAREELAEERRAKEAFFMKLLTEKQSAPQGPDITSIITQMAQAQATNMASMSQTLMDAQLAVFKARVAEPTEKPESMVDLLRDALPPIAGAIASRLRQAPAAAPAPAAPAQHAATADLATAPREIPSLPVPVSAVAAPAAPASTSTPTPSPVDPADRLRRKVWTRKVLVVLDHLQAIQTGALPDDEDQLSQVANEFPVDLADLVQRRDQHAVIDAVSPIVTSSDELKAWVESDGVVLWLADYLARVADQLEQWVLEPGT
jgi:hypothetical protein